VKLLGLWLEPFTLGTIWPRQPQVSHNCVIILLVKLSLLCDLLFISSTVKSVTRTTYVGSHHLMWPQVPQNSRSHNTLLLIMSELERFKFHCQTTWLQRLCTETCEHGPLRRATLQDGPAFYRTATVHAILLLIQPILLQSHVWLTWQPFSYRAIVEGHTWLSLQTVPYYGCILKPWESHLVWRHLR
jgi:hypothetical protein